MKISEERIADYNVRINEWMTKQGLFFLLRHGNAGLGQGLPIFNLLFRFFGCLGVLAVLSTLGIGVWAFFAGYGSQFETTAKNGLEKHLGGKELKIKGFERDGTRVTCSAISCEGTDQCFFEFLTANGVSVPCSIGSGIVGNWDAKKITCGALNARIKGGEASDEQAAASWQSLFNDSEKFQFHSIESGKTSIAWGYEASHSWGSILNASMIATRSKNQWTLTFKGGTFSHGPFRNLENIELVIDLNKDTGFSIARGIFAKGEGRIEVKGKTISGGAAPQLAIEGILSNFALSHFLPPILSERIGGSVDGTFEATGTLNDAQGLAFEFKAKPGETPLSFSTEIPLIRLLSLYDTQNSFRRLSFEQGNFRMLSKTDEVVFSEVNLLSFDEIRRTPKRTLSGSLVGHPSTTEDLEREDVQLNQLEGLSTQNEMERTVFLSFRSSQFENPHIDLLLKTKNEKDKELGTSMTRTELRRAFRVPYQLDGSLYLGMPSELFENLPNFPLFGPSEENSNLTIIPIGIDSLALELTKELSRTWEREAGKQKNR